MRTDRNNILPRSVYHFTNASLATNNHPLAHSTQGFTTHETRNQTKTQRTTVTRHNGKGTQHVQNNDKSDRTQNDRKSPNSNLGHPHRNINRDTLDNIHDTTRRPRKSWLQTHSACHRNHTRPADTTRTQSDDKKTEAIAQNCNTTNTQVDKQKDGIP